MDEPHLMAATRYVEVNPVRAGLAPFAERWAWSSAAAHVSGKPDVLAESAWLAERTAGWVCSWGEYLRQTDGRDVAAAMRRHAGTGRPMGDLTFVEKIGQMLGRDLMLKRPGPVAKKTKSPKR